MTSSARILSDERGRQVLPVAIAAALALGLAISLAGCGGSEPAAEEPEATEVAEPEQQEAVEPEAVEEEEAEPEASAPQAEAPGAAFDADGLPTLFAVSELSGADIVANLEGSGWTWDEERLWFASDDAAGIFYVSGPEDYEYTYDETVALPAFGAGDPVALTIAGSDGAFASASEFVEDLSQGVTVEAIEWLDEEQTTGIVAFSNSASDRSVALVSHPDRASYYIVTAFSTTALEQNMVAEWFGEDVGTSVDEIWNNLFGHTPGA